MKKRVFTIAVTGGPCAGKTTLLDKIRREASAIPNVKVFFAKEAATVVKHSGISFMDAGGDSTFQELIIAEQLTAESRAFMVANKYAESHPDEKAVIICDRGIMDGEAYFDSPSDFAKILLKSALTKEIVYDRYDAVVCMRSAAIGAREFYTTMDGTPRDETPDQAAILDNKVCAAWRNHKCYVEVDNSFNFYEKLDRAMAKIFSVADIELPKEVCKRYVVEMPSMFDINLKSSCMSLSTDQIFFLKENEPNAFSSLKIRRAGKSATYYLSNQRWEKVKHPETGELVETAVVDTVYCIPEKEFVHSLGEIDSSLKVMEKVTYSFYLGSSVHCELDMFACNNTRAYLSAFLDVDTPENRMLIEKLFKIVREVTYNKDYSDHEIARSEGRILDS